MITLEHYTGFRGQFLRTNGVLEGKREGQEILLVRRLFLAESAPGLPASQPLICNAVLIYNADFWASSQAILNQGFWSWAQGTCL